MARLEKPILNFGSFAVHTGTGELWKSGIRRKLADQPARILLCLLERPGEVVTREELRTLLWGDDTFVDFEHGLSAAINKLREALSDSASNPRFIETVPKRGYRFIAPVTAPAAAAVTAPPPVVDPPGRSRWPWFAAAGVVCVLGLLAFLWARSRPDTPPQYRLTQLTRDDGITFQPALSGDGNFIAYSSDRATGKDLDIWIQRIGGGKPIRLTEGAGDESHPSLSRDGGRVAYFSDGPERGIHVAPGLGGAAKLISAAGLLPSLSPDGQSVAFSTGKQMQASRLYVAPAQGGAEREFAADQPGAYGPFWSLNGSDIFFIKPLARLGQEVYRAPAAGGPSAEAGIVRAMGSLGWRLMMQLPYARETAPALAAHPGGVLASVWSNGGHDVWIVPSGGAPVRVTTGAAAVNPSADANGRIAFARVEERRGLWRQPLDPVTGRASGEPKRLSVDNASVAYPNSCSDGNTLVYTSDRSGKHEIWIRDLAAGADRLLTTSAGDGFRALISPDCASVAYGGVGRPQPIRVAPVRGAGGERTLCEGCGLVLGWTPDSRKLLYWSGHPIRETLLDVRTGAKQDVVWHREADVHSGQISPDGRWIAFVLVAGNRRTAYVTALDGVQGGRPESWIQVSDDGFAVDTPVWSPGGNVLYLAASGASGDLWARRLDPVTKRPLDGLFLVRSSSGPRYQARYFGPSVTKDAIYFSMSELRANVWLAEPLPGR